MGIYLLLLCLLGIIRLPLEKEIGSNWESEK